MEVFVILFGACVVIPVALGLTIFLVSRYVANRLSRKMLTVVLLIIWVPIMFATASELWWMFVEEPRRIAAGEPIE